MIGSAGDRYFVLNSHMPISFSYIYGNISCILSGYIYIYTLYKIRQPINDTNVLLILSLGCDLDCVKLMQH
jgi:hypothetical protein